MVRGPMALFGAIIAVGLGPALWLGAQFGHITVDPTAPKVPITADATKDSAPGRAGAAVDEAGLDTKLNVVPGKAANDGTGRRLVPLSNPPSARPSSQPPVIGQPQRTPSVAPTVPATTPTDTSGPPSTPAPESTTPPPPVEPTEPTDPAPTDEASTPADTPTTDAGTPTNIATEPVPPAAQTSEV